MKAFIVGVVVAVGLATASAVAYLVVGITAEEYFSTDAALLEEDMPEEFVDVDNQGEQ